MLRRFLGVLTAFAAVAAVARGEIALVGEPVEIVMTGKTASHAVFYTGGTATTVSSITPLGPLAHEQGITLQDGEGPTPDTRSVRITVTPGDPKPAYGTSYSGALILTNVAGATREVLGRIPVKITFPAPVFTVDPVHADLCVPCGGPHVIPVRIKNTGVVPIERIRIGVLTLHTSAHDWVLPVPGKPATQTQREELVFAPGTEAPLRLEPGESRTVSVSYEPPRYAGDYSGSIEVFSAGREAVRAAVTLRSRGPRLVGIYWAPTLFFLLLLLGAGIAWKIEDYFGTGGGAIRAEAMLALADTRRQLESFVNWVKAWDADGKKLPRTLGRAERSILDLNEAIDASGERTPEELRDRAKEFRDVLAKRRIFRSRLEFAADKLGSEGAAGHLDPIEDNGTPEAYRDNLDAALRTERSLNMPESLPTAQAPDFQTIKRRDQWMKGLRRWTVIAVSIATAFLALYYGKCAFGNARDYIETFFWGLGLTAAGNALIREGNTQYKREG